MGFMSVWCARLVLAVVALLVSTGCGHSAADRSVNAGNTRKFAVPVVAGGPSAIPREAPIVHLTTWDGGGLEFDPNKPLTEEEFRGREPLRVVLLIWSDGTAVWSDDTVRGGRPYHLGRVDRGRLRSFVRRHAESDRVDREALNGRMWIDHDGPRSVLAVHGSGGRSVELISDHELRGMGAPREGAEYLSMRRAWTEMKQGALELIPAGDSGLIESLEVVWELRSEIAGW